MPNAPAHLDIPMDASLLSHYKPFGSTLVEVVFEEVGETLAVGSTRRTWVFSHTIGFASGSDLFAVKLKGVMRRDLKVIQEQHPDAQFVACVKVRSVFTGDPIAVPDDYLYEE